MSYIYTLLGDLNGLSGPQEIPRLDLRLVAVKKEEHRNTVQFDADQQNTSPHITHAYISFPFSVLVFGGDLGRSLP